MINCPRSIGIETHNLGVANAMMYNWSTGILLHHNVMRRMLDLIKDKRPLLPKKMYSRASRLRATAIASFGSTAKPRTRATDPHNSRDNTTTNHENWNNGSTCCPANVFISSEEEKAHTIRSHSEYHNGPLDLYMHLVPSSFLRRKDFPLPHWAYSPTQMGGCMVGSLKMSARALLYRS